MNSARFAFPAEEGKDPLPPACNDHVFADVQASRLEPAGESVLKNSSPTAQVDGVTVPVLIGRVVAALEKSTFRP
ncbi:MAG: hypothetical protein NTV70_07315 [Acidobacteria bacterium]|nr:hypothetical protein [Acidobacteriota bacterium]